MKEILRVLAWLSLVGGVLIGVVLFASSHDPLNGVPMIAVYTAIGYALSGFVAFAVFGGMAEILDRLEALQRR